MAAQGRRRQGRWCWVRFAPFPTTDPSSPDESRVPEIGFAIGRKVGNAVVRNRIRRRMRPIVVAEALLLHPGIYLIGVKNDQAASISYEELRNDLQTVLASVTTSRP